MKNFINWIVGNPIVSNASKFVSKIAEPFGAITGTASTLKSQDKKPHIFTKI